jgi:hypothetical protein
MTNNSCCNKLPPIPCWEIVIELCLLGKVVRTEPMVRFYCALITNTVQIYSLSPIYFLILQMLGILTNCCHNHGFLHHFLILIVDRTLKCLHFPLTELFNPLALSAWFWGNGIESVTWSTWVIVIFTAQRYAF